MYKAIIRGFVPGAKQLQMSRPFQGDLEYGSKSNMLMGERLKGIPDATRGVAGERANLFLT